MAKAKETVFFCKECGYESAKWFGQCPSCHAWNSLVEAPAAPKTSRGAAGRSSTGAVRRRSENRPVGIANVQTAETDRCSTRMEELDRVLGGGIVKGSLILVGGDPGIGKSTLLLQMCHNLAEDGHKILYVSGEESLRQIKMRAERIGEFNNNLLLLCETDLDTIREEIEECRPEMVIIDSIQTMYCEEVNASPGSVSQVRESTSVFLQMAKGLSITIFLVGHVTKEGVVAGPRMLEHMVDTVLYFEGDRSAAYRILRGVKNRFGSTNEIGVFEMQEQGLAEVKNPSEYMLSGRAESASGSVVVCLMEGTRPVLVEIQALVCNSNFGLPRRTASGTDYNRVNLLMAVMEKRGGLHLGACDAYINVAGGMKANEPGLDLGIVMAVASSFKNKEVDQNTIMFGEVGLSGEVRAVSQVQQRINEAIKLGFTTCILPAASMKNVIRQEGINLVPVHNITEAVRYI